MQGLVEMETGFPYYPHIHDPCQANRKEVSNSIPNGKKKKRQPICDISLPIP